MAMLPTRYPAHRRFSVEVFRRHWLATQGKPLFPLGVSRLSSLLVGPVLALTLFWVYWPTLQSMALRWAHDPEYSHGYLVPLFALFLFWRRRGKSAAWELSSAWGPALIGASILLRLAGSYFYVGYLEELSLIPCLWGACLVLGGNRLLSRGWSAIAYLFFMLPLPYFAEVALAAPLQRLATRLSTLCLQLLGFVATSAGNVIILGDMRIGVVEACGGLSMLLTFFAVAVAAALVMRKPIADKLVLVASAIPIALTANVARITITAVLYQTAGQRSGQIFFHDIAGWFMMVLALAMLGAEAWLLSHVFLVACDPEPGPDLGSSLAH
jgi:exosortase